MSKKKKPIQPVASLARLHEIMAQRKTGQIPASTVPVIHQSKWEQMSEEEHRGVKIKEHESAKKRANDQDLQRKKLQQIAADSDELIRQMKQFYLSTNDVEKTVRQFSGQIAELNSKFIKCFDRIIDPNDKIYFAMSDLNTKFWDYISDDGLVYYFKNKYVLSRQGYVDYAYKRLGEEKIIAEDIIENFPLMISKMNATDAMKILNRHPELYNECSDEVKKIIRTQKDNNGRHNLLHDIVHGAFEIVNYFSPEEIEMLFNDYPIYFGSVVQRYPDILLKIPAHSFSKIKPSVVFQSVVKKDFVADLIKNDRNLYDQITNKHPELAAYFAKYVNVDDAVRLV